MDGLRPEFGWVCAVGVGSWFVHHLYMNINVGAARKKYGVKYPALYADASHPQANAFNCVQRAHQNSLENLPTFLSLLILGGLKYPITASIAGAVYLFGRVVFFQGYASGDAGKRVPGGMLGYFGLITLLGAVGRTSYVLLNKQ